MKQVALCFLLSMHFYFIYYFVENFVLMNMSSAHSLTPVLCFSVFLFFLFFSEKSYWVPSWNLWIIRSSQKCFQEQQTIDKVYLQNSFINLRKSPWTQGIAQNFASLIKNKNKNKKSHNGIIMHKSRYCFPESFWKTPNNNIHWRSTS